MNLIKLKNILLNKKESSDYLELSKPFHDEFMDAWKEGKYEDYPFYRNFNDINFYKHVSNELEKIQDKKKLQIMRKNLKDVFLENYKHRIKYITGEPDSYHINFLNYFTIMKKINKKLGLNEYEDIDKNLYHNTILSIFHPENIMGDKVLSYRKPFLKPGSRENKIYNEFKDHFLKTIDDPETLTKIKNHYENWINNTRYENIKQKARENYEKYILPYIEEREHELQRLKKEEIEKHKKRMTKVIETMHPEEEQKSPIQKILEKLKIK